LSEEANEPKKGREEDAWALYQKLPRYIVGLQKPTDSSCYVNFHETNSLKEAKEQAELTAKKENRKTAVIDRHDFPGIVYKGEPNPEPEQKIEEKPVKKGKGKVKRYV
jgi:hypothetical protein